MKKKDLIRQLEAVGYLLVRHGGKHDWYHNPTTKISQPIPWHTQELIPLMP